MNKVYTMRGIYKWLKFTFYPLLFCLCWGLYYLSLYIPLYPWIYFIFLFSSYFLGCRPSYLIGDTWTFDRYTLFIVNKESQMFKYKPDRKLSLEYVYSISDIVTFQKYKGGNGFCFKLYYYRIVLKDGKEFFLSSFLVGNNLETVFSNIKCEKVKKAYAYPLGAF